MTIAQALARAIPILDAAGVETPRLDAQLLLAWVLKTRREDLAREPERAIGDRELLVFDKAVQLRSERRPLPYITGEAWFYGRSFKVNRAVLIPRPETEMLVDFALAAYRDSSGKKPFRVADIGTGSGCIAVTIAAELPEAELVATDISRLALLVTSKNRWRYGLERRIDLREGSLFDPFEAGEGFDVIVSNPPYIPAEEASALMPEVRDYEPALALFGAEDVSLAPDPDRLRKQLLEGALAHLAHPEGRIAVEIGIGQGAQARSDAESLGYGAVELLRDSSGIERVLVGRRG